MKTYLKLSSAAVVISTLRIKNEPHKVIMVLHAYASSVSKSFAVAGHQLVDLLYSSQRFCVGHRCSHGPILLYTAQVYIIYITTFTLNIGTV